MAQYEADKIVHLLQFCCWKSKCTMDFTGFKVLAEKIDNASERGQITPNDRYFSDLLSDAGIAMQKDNLVGRRQAYIDLLLRFAGFNSWNSWKHALYAASEYVRPESIDLSTFESMGTKICFPSVTEPQVLPEMSFIERYTDYPIQLQTCKEEAVADQLQFVLEQAKELPFLIWIIPLRWKDQIPVLKNPGWEEIVATGRIVPIWMDEKNPWPEKLTLVNWLKPQQFIEGLGGIFACLLFLQDCIKKYHKPNSTGKEPLSSRATNQYMQHNKGTFFMGETQIKGDHLTMGDLHQTIYNNQNDKHEY